MQRLRASRRDAALAAVLFLVGQAEIWVVGNQNGPKALAVPAVVFLTLPLAWRRAAPLAVLAVGFAVFALEAVVVAVTELTLPPPTSAAMLVGWIVAVYSTGAHADLPRALLGAALGASFQPIAVAVDPARSPADVDPVSVLFILIPWATGVALRRHRAQAERLRELAARLERERLEQSRAAVAEERARIARELHDEIAHSISVIAVQADAAEGALARDPRLAREPLGAIKTTARSALVEMRRMLGALRDAGEAPTLAPRPGLAQLPALVEQTRSAGVPVEVTVEGIATTLAPPLDASAYRILQEGLTNVRKHAGSATAHVVVRYGARDLQLEVRDDGLGMANGDRTGHGLLGIRERAALHGGEIDAGPAPGGGYALRARLPLEEAEA